MVQFLVAALFFVALIVPLAVIALTIGGNWQAIVRALAGSVDANAILPGARPARLRVSRAALRRQRHSREPVRAAA